jgi:hypothetical protein|tara:strand:+ start:65 stop:289 length:225 start_codon:yes stop_codon:yes gene_type:complete
MFNKIIKNERFIRFIIVLATLCLFYYKKEHFLILFLGVSVLSIHKVLVSIVQRIEELENKTYLAKESTNDADHS